MNYFLNQIQTNSFILFCLVLVFFTSCKKDIEVKPRGNEQAKAVWNCAYQENFEPDQISEVIDNAENAYVLIDPFDNEAYQYISTLKAKGNEVCGYISIGTGEDWRSDWEALKPYCVSKQWKKWDGEYFIDVTNTGVVDVMKERIDQLASWGCDWVEFDNMDWAFDEKNKKTYGFAVSEEEAITYYNTLCEYVHLKGMKCQAKNTVKQANSFDGVLYESFHKEMDWWVHDEAQNFLNKGKLVIINHYNERRPNAVYQDYINLYNMGISYICESKKDKKYIHYNN
jgi:hypothetical protein